MRRALPVLAAVLALVAAGCGGKSAADTYASQQIAACAKAEKLVAAVPRPKAQPATAKRGSRAPAAILHYAVQIDQALLAGLPDLRSVTAPGALRPVQEQWLATVKVALRARLRLDTAPAKQIQTASKNELKARRAANDLAGRLGISSGCTLTY